MNGKMSEKQSKHFRSYCIEVNSNSRKRTQRVYQMGFISLSISTAYWCQSNNQGNASIGNLLQQQREDNTWYLKPSQSYHHIKLGISVVTVAQKKIDLRSLTSKRRSLILERGIQFGNTSLHKSPNIFLGNQQKKYEQNLQLQQNS